MIVKAHGYQLYLSQVSIIKIIAGDKSCVLSSESEKRFITSEPNQNVFFRSLVYCVVPQQSVKWTSDQELHLSVTM